MELEQRRQAMLQLQYIPRNMHTVFALLCFVVVIYWLIFPYPSGLLHWHCGNLTIAQVPAKQPWWIWINTSCEFIMSDCITTTKQSTTKPCAYFLGYTVHLSYQQFYCLLRCDLYKRLYGISTEPLYQYERVQLHMHVITPTAVEVMTCMNNYIPRELINELMYPCPAFSKSLLVNGAPIGMFPWKVRECLTCIIAHIFGVMPHCCICKHTAAEAKCIAKLDFW